MSDEMRSEQQGTSKCLVCENPHDNLHFGALTCRSCAAFFRRRTISGRHYKCRSNGQCLIEKDMNKYCKFCRYNKCLKVGMTPSLVQLFRDKIGPRNDSSNNSPTKMEIKTESSFEYYEDDFQPSTSSLSSHQSPSHFAGSKKRRSSEPSYVMNDSPNYDGLAFEMNTKIRIQSPQQFVLERLQQGYQQYRQEQKNLYSMLYPSKTISHEPRKIKYSEYFQMKRGSYSLIFSMLNDFFQPFDQLDQQLKKSCLKPFTESFFYLDEAYRTSIEFPDPEDTRISCNYGQFVDQTDLKYFYQETEMATTKIGLAKTSFTNLRHLVNKMNEIEIRELEVATLAAVILWNEVALIDHNITNAQEIQAQLYSELHSNIASIYGVENAGIRMGSLMCFLHDLNTISQLFLEITALTKIFDPNLIDSWNE